MPRTYVYDVLDQLSEKGIVLRFTQKKITHFEIDDLNKIHHYQKQKNRIAKSVVDDLVALKQSSKQLDINYFLGKEGYQHLYGDILKSNPREILTWINYENFSDMLDPEFEKEWTQERIKRNILAKMLIIDSPTARKLKDTDDLSSRVTKIVPERFSFDNTFIVYGDHAVIFENIEGQVSGLRINSKATATMLKNIFEMCWGSID